MLDFLRVILVIIMAGAFVLYINRLMIDRNSLFDELRKRRG